MFGIDSGELLIVAIVALVVIGPRDLPKVMRTIGHWMGRARGMARHFRAGMDTMIRESELEEMQKTWAADNERIMREHPAVPTPPEAAGQPAPGEAYPPAAPAVEAAPSGDRTPPPAPPRRSAPPAPARTAPPAPPRELP